MKNSKELFLKVLHSGMDKKSFAKKLKSNDGTVNLILMDLSNGNYLMNGKAISKEEYEATSDLNKESLQNITLIINPAIKPIARSESEVIL